MNLYYPKVINKTIPVGNNLGEMGNGPECTSRLGSLLRFDSGGMPVGECDAVRRFDGQA